MKTTRMSASTDTTETQDEGARRAEAAVEELRAAPHLFLVMEGERPASGGARYALEGVGQVVFGRGPARSARRETNAGVVTLFLELPGRSISGRHARLVRSRATWVLEDLQSKNGTFVEGERITRATIEDGTCFDLGRALFVLETHVPTPRAFGDRDTERETEALPGLVSLRPELEAEHVAFARVAASHLALLVRGETGTGKELLARAAHTLSGRTGPLVAVNCGAISVGLLESALFGHERGAFSGAVRDEPGFVRAAHGGTLFLDEVGDLPPSSQAALLRVLEEREVVPVGAARPVKVDVRIVGATHRPLEDDVAAGRFRADLLARLAGYTHVSAPLRARTVDLGVLVAHILRQLSRTTQRDVAALTFEAEAVRALTRYAYPHNGRELRQAVEAAVVLAENGTIALRHLPAAIQRGPTSFASDEADATDAEREALVAALTRARGNVAQVARAMDKAPTQVRRWMKKWRLDPAAFRLGR